MKGISTLAVAAGLFVAGSGAIQLVQRDGPPAVVGFDIQRRKVSSPLARDRIRRRATSTTVSQTLDNEETLYFANVSLGTPAQNLRLHIDTGSSDLWTNSAKSKLCKMKSDPCSASGSYSANSSSTYKYVSSDFNISYVDGSGAVGDYATDTLRIGGKDLTDLQFGIGYTSSSEEGIIGIGYTVNEIQVNRNNKSAYPNVPQLMMEKGIIQSNAYSLWLNDLQASEGAILFGGVNSDKFHGDLETLPILSEDGVYAEFIITLTGVGYTSGGKNTSLTSSNTAAAVLLDSGSSLTYLPDDIAESIFDAFGAQYDSQEEAAFVPCSLANNDTTLDFTFSSPTISVSMNELVINPGTNPDGSTVTFKDGTPACIFGIGPAGDSTSVLGDTFIRSAYVVYDLSRNEISLAQTNFNSTTDNILEITNTTIPDAHVVANPVTSVAAQTGGARIGAPSGTGIIGGSGTAVATSTATTTGSSKSAAAPKNVPLGAVLGLAGVGLMLVI
ncbi:MAG: hypothetical protein M1819_007409 [Sarea resinae]|nr:MAG: hypothetical protein M1819_007409 [Sarea resinae]